MVSLGADLWQKCVTFEAGSPMPITVEYKFQKDDCGTWESDPNRVLVIDNDSPSEGTVTHTWDDGVGTCEPVPVEAENWGALKARF